MTTLEKIKKAWDMGWSATILEKKKDEFSIVGVYKNQVLRRNNNGDLTKYWLSSLIRDDIKITGYKYAGELAGNEDIPDGMIFKVKDITWNKDLIDKLVEHKGYGGSGSSLMANYGGKEYRFEKHEIEPVFE